MKFHFDEPIDRRGTSCVKWDESPSADVIPMWVADMDFPVAPAIQEAIKKRAEHSIFGYTIVEEDYYEAVISWFHRRHQWTIQREEILYTTGVIPAMSCAIKALTMPGEKVLILSPDYNCFFSSIRNNGCEVSETILVKDGDSFVVDWEDFEQRCADEKTTVFLLCNPHNPTGRVWSKEELERMNTICMKYGVKVISDEIHGELIMPGYLFQPFATVNDACRQNSVILNSPSKSFNIAGLQTANIICSQPEWRRRIDRAINIHEVCDLNPFGPVALKAAYNESEEWIDELNQYLWDNYQALCQFFEKELPLCKVTQLEGTYLVWLDVTRYSNDVEKLCDDLLTKGKVWVNPGTMYGAESGKGYIRINIACPRSRMMEGLERIKETINHETKK
ncbi:MalY/PatB family protein [Prevotella sp. tf2-5]|uniref:MalY/PatB family protein n=1 Tax=Prevotella sp. tf2-5 TaxID=1761889 RepID=UPI0008EC55F5|nr:MalY/PatB family protein [Prevotella sp. tf2-5]SFO68003.1 cystathione beta-lyase [Prevotella sp. tf2-5]